MARIPDEHLLSVVFIYSSLERAQAAHQTGASGFLSSFPTGVRDITRPYVVTNQHVLDSGGRFVRFNKPDGSTGTIEIPAEDWNVVPPDDIAFAPLPVLPFTALHLTVPLGTLALRREDVEKYNVGPGDEIYMVGRFIGHSGRIAVNPIVRFGNISLMPEPTELVLDGRGQTVEAYLVEMRSRSGFSGSPVSLILPRGGFRGEIGDTSLEDNMTRFFVLGVDTGNKIEYLATEERDDAEQPWRASPNQRAVATTDISVVAPIWGLLDRLAEQSFVDERREWGEREAVVRDQRARLISNPPDGGSV